MENCVIEEVKKGINLAPKTPPPKRVQLRPKIAYSRRRLLTESKFSHFLVGPPETAPPPVGPTTTPTIDYDPHAGPVEQSEQKKKEIDENKFCSEKLANVIDTNSSKKRKRNEMELNNNNNNNKGTTKTPKKKIHRPKVVGERKPRQLKTPKPKTPKRPYTKRNTPKKNNTTEGSEQGIGIDNNNNNNADPKVAPSRRSLNFDNDIIVAEKLLGEDQISGVASQDLTPDLRLLVATKRKRSKLGALRKPQSESFQPSEAETYTLNENLSCDFKSIEFSEETAKICNATNPSLIDLNLPCVENETSLVEQSSEQNDIGAIVPQAIVDVDQIQREGQLCVVNKTRKELMLECYKDKIKAWKLQVKSIGYGNTADEEAKEKLESERATFRDRIRVFTSCMHIILGDRTFTKWKGSVIDSVIGVFLTQNVSDILSSSAFIDLRARFPIQSSKDHENHPVGFKLLDIEDVASNSSCQEDSRFSDSCSALEEIVNIMDRLIMDDDEHKSSREQCSSETKESSTMIESKGKKNEAEKVNKNKEEEKTDWEEVKKRYRKDGKRSDEHRDSVDWEAVRHAPVGEIADAIKKRGQHNNIAKRIQEFLNRVVELHKTLDLEWLRDSPADQVQKYLLEFNGLGLKSVECIRLLAIQNVAFPVDTNVGRIAVRLGWVPLEPLPEELQIHLIQLYPIMDSIQKYLWPRLCTLDQRQLYELHYHLITFGKVFCTKRNPNCNECPMKAECRHYASHYASARKALPAGPEKKQGNSSPVEVVIHQLPPPPSPSLPFFELEEFFELTTQFQTKSCEPIIEMPQSPEPEREQFVESDVVEEHYVFEDGTEIIPTIRLDKEPQLSQAMVPLAPEVASYPVPKLKSVSRLRTKHLVYELPDSHPILAGLDARDVDDPLPYLLAIQTSDETTGLSNACCSQEHGKTVCDEETYCSCTGHREQNRNTVHGTILIPCRTAMRGRFPLNGTYFQVNEVFADNESSHNPIDVPTEFLWNLRRRYTYFGTSTTTIFKGLTMDEITINFWSGFMCNRAYDRKTGTTKPLALRLHMSTVQQARKRKKKEKLD